MADKPRADAKVFISPFLKLRVPSVPGGAPEIRISERIIWTSLGLLVVYDLVLAYLAVSNATGELAAMRAFFEPLHWVSLRIGFEVTGNLIAGPFPRTYYDTLMLSSALVSSICALAMGWRFIRRFRFLRVPAYAALSLERANQRLADSTAGRRLNGWWRIRLITLAISIFNVGMVTLIYHAGSPHFTTPSPLLPLFISLLPIGSGGMSVWTVLLTLSFLSADYLRLRRS